MRLIDWLNTAQRVVIVVAIGIALAVAGHYAVSLRSGFHGGWTGYRLLPGQIRTLRTGMPRWLRLIIWLGLTGIWALASVIVLRPPSGPAGPK